LCLVNADATEFVELLGAQNNLSARCRVTAKYMYA